MAALKINLEDFIMALTFGSGSALGEITNFLDTDTGAIVLAGDGVDEELIPPDLEDNPRYRKIESIKSSEEFRIMEDFVERLGNTAAAQRLSDALSQPKPFRRFTDALFDAPALRESWFAFELAEHMRLANAWCEQHGITAEWT